MGVCGGVTRVLMLEPPLWEEEGTLRQDLRPLGTSLCPPAPGDQAAQLHHPPLVCRIWKGFWVALTYPYSVLNPAISHGCREPV